ncbi:MAG: tetratricopeptide repeat protein, partial [Terriglobia bacterium]
MKYAACFVLAVFSGSAVWAQATGTAPSAGTGGGAAPGAGGSTATGGTTAPSVGRPGAAQPNTAPNVTQPTPLQQPIFLSGKIIVDDGSPIPVNTTIQRVCNGVASSVAYADSKGRFSFEWGQSNGIMQDASESGFGTRNNNSSSMSGMPQQGGGMNTSSSMTSFNNCELRANIAGYRSESLSLLNRNSLDNPDVGSILVHRLGNVEGTSVSATSLGAPKDARKAYERGLQSVLKNKNDEAAKDFEKAVEVYPRYADAWVSLGKVRMAQNSYERAREAMLKAIELDAKLIGPYVELGFLAGMEKKWETATAYFDRALKLDPVEFPQAWFANAIANFNLKRYDVAEKDIREAIRLDPKHINSRAGYLLGLVLLEKRDYP